MKGFLYPVFCMWRPEVQVHFRSIPTLTSNMSARDPMSTQPADDRGTKLSAVHIEDSGFESLHKRKLKNAGRGADTALALFSDQSDLHEPHDPAEEAKLIRRIDLMILPYLSVCYVFFYVSLSVNSKVSFNVWM